MQKGSRLVQQHRLDTVSIRQEEGMALTGGHVPNPEIIRQLQWPTRPAPDRTRTDCRRNTPVALETLKDNDLMIKPWEGVGDQAKLAAASPRPELVLGRQSQAVLPSKSEIHNSNDCWRNDITVHHSDRRETQSRAEKGYINFSMNLESEDSVSQSLEKYPKANQTRVLKENKDRDWLRRGNGFKAPCSRLEGLVNEGGAWKPVESAQSEESEPPDFQPLSM
ncbi:hypothetical protein EYF80_010353 [Liparis tanakae]|uniref:Uncharacterized protein n=1 Tax=Liparis tanakae TaxID=230148 RepID=A0A4Z2IMR5_9TELE|nr:hypothetical protein EYF80_010353 [Liparis tanakae]